MPPMVQRKQVFVRITCARAISNLDIGANSPVAMLVNEDACALIVTI